MVKIDPGGMASLEGWQAPDGGQRVATIHDFSGLEPRSYSLKVFRDGYASCFQVVTVISGETTKLEFHLTPSR